MKRLIRYLLPALFGLLIYVSIRLVTDTPNGEQFWTRSLRQNVIEITFCLAVPYLFNGIMDYFIRKFNEQRSQFSVSALLKEYAVVCVTCFVMVNPALLLVHYLTDDPVSLADVVIANIVGVLYTLLYYSIGRGNRLIQSYIAQQVQVERLTTENLQTELKFLKAQYHPHFLFNALNTVYFQMDESIPAAKETIERFSDLLRYQLYDQQQMVPIRQELQHLKNFIHLQKARASDKLLLEVQVDEQLGEEKVFPLLLLPLVENAFKYVGGAYEITIEANKIGEELLFEVRNSVPLQTTIKKGGIGLENLQRRLELLYPGKHQLMIKKSMTHFVVRLNLPLHVCHQSVVL